MEQHIRKLEAELHNRPDDFQLRVVRRQAPIYKSFIKLSSHGEFLQTLQSAEIPSIEQASLEVLVTEHSTSTTLGLDHNPAGHPTNIHQRTHRQSPERLRIRYAPLVKTLEKVCREVLSNNLLWPSEHGITGSRTRGAATILLRPWKLFVAYEKEIRESIHNIDALIEPAQPKDVSEGVAEKGVVEECECFPS